MVYIPYSNNLERTDESLISSRHVGKNLSQLIESVDSMDCRIDSINRVYGVQLHHSYFKNVNEARRNDTLFFEKIATRQKEPINLDSIYASLQPRQMVKVTEEAQNRSRAVVRSFDIRKEMQAKEYKDRALHEIEIHRKFTLSIACLLFFLIGAPLGAIIRKGGLGVPVIVSVVFFIIYYIIDTFGYERARAHDWCPWFGIWFSSLVLAPIGAFLTWRAINDSTLFDWDAYKIAFIRVTRRVTTFLKNRGIINRTTLLNLRYAISHKREETPNDN